MRRRPVARPEPNPTWRRTGRAPGRSNDLVWGYVMRPVLLFALVMMMTGCARRVATEALPPAAAGASTVIHVGQPWREATAVARGAGYELYDASELAMDPAPD